MSDPLHGAEAVSDRSKHKKQDAYNATHTQGALGGCGRKRDNGKPGNMNAAVAAMPNVPQMLSDDAGRPTHGSGNLNACKMCSAPHNLARFSNFKCLSVVDCVALVRNHGFV